MRVSRRPGLLLVSAGVGVHVGVLTAAHVSTGRVDGFAFRSLDAGEYYRIARHLAADGAFSQSETPPLTPDTWRTPGYPLFLAVLIRVVGASPIALVLMQQALSVLNVWLLFAVARKCMTDRRAALCAAIFLLEPYHLFYSLWLLGTTLFTTALLLTWIAWRITMKTGDRRWALLLGGLAGFDVLVRPIALLVPVAIGLGLLLVRSGARGLGAGDGSNRWAARRCRSAVVFALACAAVVGSWMMRNRWVAGHFALSHQGGVVLASFKAAEVDLWREGRAADRYVETSLNPARSREGHVAWERIDRALRERFAGASEADRAALSWRNLAQGNHTKLDSFDISRELARIGRERLLDDPLSTLSCCLIRCGSLLTFPLNLALRPPPGAAERRWRFAAVGLVYLALVIAVFVRLARGGWSLAEVYFPIAVTLALLLATTPQLDPRFRVAMIPMLALLTSLPVPRQRESSRDAPTE